MKALQQNSLHHAHKKEERILTPVVWCILVTETGERFSYFGFRAVLVLYFTQVLEYDENQAIALFAYTTCLAYLTPLAGALLSDGHWGRYKTIFYFGVVYVLGLIILTVAAWFEFRLLASKRAISFIGLFLVCVGTGGIKPCVSAFGADQVGQAQTVPQSHHDDEAEPGAQVSRYSPYTGIDMATENDAILLRRSDPLDPRETAVLQDRSEQVRGFFNMFYWCINVGAVTSIALIPIVRHAYGYQAAFLVPAVFMVSALLLFVSKRKDYVHEAPRKDGSSLIMTFRLTIWLVQNHIWSVPSIARMFPFLCPGPLSSPTRYMPQHQMVPTRDDGTDFCESTAVDETNVNDSVLNQQLNDAAQAIHVLPILAMFPIFWALYDQQSSVWTLQAQRMALNGLQPEQLNVVNPVQIMLFIPLFDRVIYPAMQARRWNIEPLRRMACGMALSAVAFFVSGLVESAIQHREENNLKLLDVFWQLPQITILAVAEILFSVTGLEFAYSTSPDRLKSFLMAVFLLTTAVGDFSSGILFSTVFTHLNRATVMHVCALLMLGNLGLFMWVARWYERSSFQSIRRVGSLQGVEFQDRQLA
jgi:proton-dependent oligopeptide transporter, POT family